MLVPIALKHRNTDLARRNAYARVLTWRHIREVASAL